MHHLRKFTGPRWKLAALAVVVLTACGSALLLTSTETTAPITAGPIQK